MTIFFELLGLLVFLAATVALMFCVAPVYCSIAEQREEAEKLARRMLLVVVLAAAMAFSNLWFYGLGQFITHCKESYQ